MNNAIARKNIATYQSPRISEIAHTSSGIVTYGMLSRTILKAES